MAKIQKAMNEHREKQRKSRESTEAGLLGQVNHEEAEPALTGEEAGRHGCGPKCKVTRQTAACHAITSLGAIKHSNRQLENTI